MADELIDIYDEDMVHLGTAMKFQAHKEGLWHKAFHCWIVKPAKDGKHIVWLQLRSKDKDLYPDLLDISSARHLAAGEKARDGIREIEKEIGLKVDQEKLTKLFTNVQIIDLYNIKNKEFNPTYVLETDTKLSDLEMQPEEVDGVYEAQISELINLVSGKSKIITINGLYRNDDNTYKNDTRDIKINELVPRGKDLYLKTLEALTRFCNGVTK